VPEISRAADRERQIRQRLSEIVLTADFAEICSLAADGMQAQHQAGLDRAEQIRGRDVRPRQRTK
jgi:hypothetical protein